MNNSKNIDVASKSNDTAPTPPTPLRCLTGAVISSSLALAGYSLTASIAQTFATKPINSNSPAVINIAAAVRTLVIGITALGTGIFGLVAIGLVALAIQLVIQKLTQRNQE